MRILKKITKWITLFFKQVGRSITRFRWRNLTWQRLVRWTGFTTAIGFALLLILFFSVREGLFGKLPAKEELQNISNFNASEVYSYDSILLGKYYIENRTNTTFENISPYIKDALIATEDVRFYQHDGIDKRSLARVIIKSILLQDESSGGGSTLTQQLAKNLFPRQNYRFLSLPINKVKEAIIASRLEQIYSKEEILTLYLNTVPFGGNVFGIEAATKRFFNKSARKINPEEAAVLVGMLKATTSYSPRLYPERARGRRNVVLGQMVKYGYLPKEEADSLKALPLKLDYHYATHNDGLAPYFREKLRHELDRWFREHPKEDGSSYNLYTDGLRIYTTLDARVQRFAEKAVADHMKDLQATFFQHWKERKPWGNQTDILTRAMRRSKRYKSLVADGKSEEEIMAIFHQPIPMTVFTWDGEVEKVMSPMDSIAYYQMFLNAGFLAVRPDNGHIKAWVGGINHKYFQYDHVLATRQVGSTFKPIVYAAALENGEDPCEYISNEQRTYEEYKGWSPRNADNVYEGSYSMEGALSKSINTITVELMMRTGIDHVADVAHRMGVQHKIPQEPSIALGTADLSLYEMLSVYTTIVNHGVHVAPVYLLRVEDQHGNVLFNFYDKPEIRRALDRQTADMMIEMMKSVVDSGSASRLRYRYGLRNDIIGKTGTTQSHADGWFIGATPALVAGAWVGGEDPLIRFRTLSLGQGGNTALPIWALFMQQVNQEKTLQKVAYARFPQPSPDILERLDCPFYQDPEEEKGLLERLFSRDDDKQGKEKDEQVAEQTRKPNTSPTQQRRKKQKKKLVDVLKDIFGSNNE